MTPEQIKARAEWMAKAEAADKARDQAAFDAAMAEVEKIDAQAKDAQAAADRAARMAALRDPVQPARTVTSAGTTTIAVAPVGHQAAVTSVRDRVLDDPNRGYRNLGAFAADVFAAQSGNGDAMRTLAAASGMNQAVPADGGFLVPPTFATQIHEMVTADDTSLLEMCDTYPVEGESLTFVATDDTNRTSGAVAGGVIAYWKSEAAQLTGSKPKFRDVKVEPQELFALVYVTDKLMRNSPIALDQFLTSAAARAINWKVGDAIINGTGIGKPKGILASAARVTVAKEAGQGATTIVKENIDKMWSRMVASSRANAVWLINQDIETQLESLSASVGTGGVPVYLPAGGIADAPNARLKGRPVIPVQYCQTLGTEGDIMLVDMKQYLAGLRRGIDAAMSIHLRFDYAETAFRFRFEVDGQPWWASPFTPAKSSNTLSPFVTLATRA
jgi:HK97 family phage major capsid protein